MLWGLPVPRAAQCREAQCAVSEDCGQQLSPGKGRRSGCPSRTKSCGVFLPHLGTIIEDSGGDDGRSRACTGQGESKLAALPSTAVFASFFDSAESSPCDEEAFVTPPSSPPTADVWLQWFED
mmetsp:Transcript_35917/g.81060  ORF Transcript_35917/g.81060 Transcript_35917/m.81060 type:complete len:123 (-) Transcript_35917:300-668(-)